MNKLYTGIGWLGAALLAFCGAPEAFRAMTAPEYDISLIFIGMWGFGELFVLITVLKQLKAPYLVFNYAANLVFIIIIVLRITGVF